MSYMKAELYYNASDLLGEGPLWDHRTKELMWVDIEKKKLQFLSQDKSKTETHFFNQRIGFSAPASGNYYIIGLEDGLYLYNRTTKITSPLSSTYLHVPGNRWNDGKVGPDGCIWGGTMSLKQESFKGALYRLDKNQVLKQLLKDVSISNGLAWNNNLGKLYFVDSPTRTIQTFEYKLDDNEIGQPVSIFEIPEDMGYPDGMTIDEDGMLWVAHWDGHCIARWHPETGQLITKIEIPAPRVTSCIFGGNNFSTLFVTTARTGLTPDQLKEYPLSGSIFSIESNTKGIESPIYKL